ncbi:ABC transporter substrate-binding protein, partial (plasmid) [Chromobacterium amazonense]|uniref:ABC transporter substrate-binding protein n=1 Tax=Chromobacterium amazonense TaxID=1382803 RepID=UPI00237DF385
QAKAQGLLQPYKVSTWKTIPDNVKDKDGYWYGDYYGVLTFQVNKDLISKAPADWADLLKPEYKNTVALAGDPRAANQAIQGVFAAGLSQAKGDVGKSADAGLKFFPGRRWRPVHLEKHRCPHPQNPCRRPPPAQPVRPAPPAPRCCRGWASRPS